ncbi:hypothetical protein X733_20655 [Mesorhizobium sp. L2C067A000]|nr:hypothetical protein X733_20655 [Mesorhizobium sp. L2C067A000]
MSHSSDDTTDLLVEMAVDQEIASLLALVEKRRRDVKS